MMGFGACGEGILGFSGIWALYINTEEIKLGKNFVSSLQIDEGELLLPRCFYTSG